jgi:ATP-binding cassette subfamily B (MDR/TAP) protein 1
MSVMMVVMAMGNVATPAMAAAKAASAATGFFAMIDMAVPKSGGLKGPDVLINEDVVFDGVTFAYPSRPDSVVLDEVDIRFEAGKITAIVGPSGSGKSTVVALLERWYDLSATGENASEKTSIDAGSIRIGDMNINDIDLKYWRSSLGLVQQEPFIFNDTIFNNVAHGLHGSKWEDATEETKVKLVEDACRESFSDEFINRLPQVCT